MQCSRCRDDAVLFQQYSGRHLCSRHLVHDIEARARRSIRSHGWLRPGDHIAVPVRGDRKSAALLLFLKKIIASRRDIQLSAISAPGSVERDTARRIAGSLGAGFGEIEKLAATRIAIPASLDDTAEEVVRAFISGTVNGIISPPPAVWNGIPVICPFLTIPADEIGMYWDLEGTVSLPDGAPAPFTDPHRDEAGWILWNFSRRHPATRHAVLHLADELSDRSADVAAAGACRRILPGGEG